MRFYGQRAVLAAVSLPILTAALPSPGPLLNLPYPTRLIHQFPPPTIIENLAVRTNGQLLVTLNTAPEVHLIDPSNPGTASLIATIPSTLAVTGIAEYAPDVFAVLAGNFSLLTGDPGIGTWALWSIDMRRYAAAAPSGSRPGVPATVTKIAALPQSFVLNGLSLLSARDRTLLVGDLAGWIGRFDLDTLEHTIVINNTYTAMRPAGPFGNAGVDGIRVRDGQLYFANLGGGLYKVPIDRRGNPRGEFVELAKEGPGAPGQWDDFAVDKDGDVWAVTGGLNTVRFLRGDGKGSGAAALGVDVAGALNSTVLAEPTNAAFGRRREDRHVLYVTTAGGTIIPVNGGPPVGGQVVAITTDGRGKC